MADKNWSTLVQQALSGVKRPTANRPTGRKRTVSTGTGTSVFKRGTAVGGVPVGKSGGYAGRRK